MSNETSARTQKQITILTGHMIDINNQGNLRSRPEHGLAWDENGRILDCARTSELFRRYPDAVHLPTQAHELIFPGFIDAHLHFPQTRVIGSYEEDLLPWLNKHIWPEERKLKNLAYAKDVARHFMQQMFRSGTTTALVYSSQFTEATDLLFSLAAHHGTGLLTGITLQDRNTHPDVERRVSELQEDVATQIERWHLAKDGRLRYVVSPRFSPACSEEMMAYCGSLLADNNSLYCQSHINESQAEIAWVKSLYPRSKHYLDTYDQFGMVGPRTILAHSIHTSDIELARMREAGTGAVHCPSSNAFLGSGALSFAPHREHGVRLGIGSDVGGGTAFSLWKELSHLHLIQMRHPQGTRDLFDGAKMLKLVTLENARLLQLEDELGNFERGKWADLMVWSPRPGSYLHSTMEAKGWDFEESLLPERLFQIAIAAEHDMIRATYAKGHAIFLRDEASGSRFPQMSDWIAFQASQHERKP